MVSNKSIDGLSTRAVKKRVVKPAAKKPVKIVDPEDFASEPTTSIWDELDAPKKKPVKKVVVKKVVKKKPQAEGDTSDFLKPVQAFDFDEDEGLLETDETTEDMKNLSKEKETDEDEAFEENFSKHPKEKKHKKKVGKKRKKITIVALVIVILLFGVVIWAIFWGNDIIAKITGGRGNILDLFTFTTDTYDPLKTDANGRTNILALGTGGYNMDGDEGNGVHDGAQLTDSIMVISFDQKTGDVAMISLPRDLKGPATCTSTGKINEVYWCNGGSGDATTEQEEKAATAAMKAVGSILDIDFQYYAHLNWGSLAAVVDILGGITVTLDEDIMDYSYTGAVFEAGKPYNIDGPQAVGLARARHGTAGGDFSRGASQQKILVGIKDKILEKSLSIPDILSLVSTLGDNLRTNFSVNELKTVAHMPEILDFDVMRQISLYPEYMTTGMLNGISYVLPKAGANNYTTIQRFVAKQLSSDPRDYEEATIAILNASETPGLAATEKSKLEEKGYIISATDNAPEGQYPEGTTIYATNHLKPGTRKMLEEAYGKYASDDPLPNGIAADYDFIIILNPTDN